MTNTEIKKYMKDNGVKQWEVAEYLGIGEATICRKLRRNVDSDFEKQIIRAVDVLKNERR